LVNAQVAKFGFGVRGGAGKIDGDGKVSELSPVASGVFSFTLWPHLLLNLEGGYGELQLGANADTVLLRTIPLGLDLSFRFSPYAKLTPFATLGGGGMFWQHLHKDTKQIIPTDGKTEKFFDYFAKASGGLDIFLSSKLTLTFGASYTYTFTDKIDFTSIGDQDDGVITAFSGLTFNIGGGGDDADRDGVPDRYDLDSSVKEDRDGYLDHDGVPDASISESTTALVSMPALKNHDTVPPIVIHEPLRRASAGSELQIRAEIFENQSLQKAAVLYRPVNMRQWLVEPLTSAGDNLFVGHIPKMAVQKPGIEYCIVAVDEAVSGVGYSGTMDRPNVVSVHGSETGWRFAFGLAAAAGWGAATYSVYRTQR
jgi:hypothetical protein